MFNRCGIDKEIRMVENEGDRIEDRNAVISYRSTKGRDLNLMKKQQRKIKKQISKIKMTD